MPEMPKISVARILMALMLLCHPSIAQFLGLSFLDIVPGLDCLVGYDDNCGELPDGTVPFLVKMCSKGGPKQIDCREVLKNIDPVGTKKDAYCNISSKDSVGPVCFFNGAEYSVNDKNEVKLEASGTRTVDAASSATATSTLLFATATNYGSKTTHKTFFPNTTTSSESSSSSNDDDATRTTDASMITTDSSSMETTLRSTEDVTVTIPPPAASTAANAPPRSASAARGSLMASGVVGSLVVAFLVEICFLVLFDID
ncbi:hypothetical protein EMCG_09099 [[Emmonsia] crescens]|uniref:Uncharacterized protein n=1 Tax=[Emmonsia] crescens TaxID=73230 RepID=A0A0G2I2Y2_9EURO|nr:hypothetical protein EMCG_09099 [Emmonsia crescens UAMH 3008]